MVSPDFVAWVEDERTKRGWTRAELARRGKLTTAQVTRVLNREQNPGSVFLKGIALALDVPLLTIMRHVGTLPPVSIRDELSEEAQYLFDQLKDENDKRKIINIIRVYIGDEDEGKVNHRMSSRNHNRNHAS